MYTFVGEKWTENELKKKNCQVVVVYTLSLSHIKT